MKRSLGPFLLLAFILVFARPPRPPSLPPHRSKPARPVFAASGSLPGLADRPEIPAESGPGAASFGDPWGGGSAGSSPDPPRQYALVEVEERLFLQPSLKWLLDRQNPDGSWGTGRAFLEGHEVGKVAGTSLALLAFLGDGYTHLSKDHCDGHEIGSVVRRAAQWLMQDQGGGVFGSARDRSLEQALGALALCEIHGLTGSMLFRADAQNALDGLRGFQLQDGSFGDAMTNDWALAAIQSARMSDLSLWDGGLDRLRPAYERRERAMPDAGTALFRIWVDKAGDDDRVRRAAELISLRPAVWGAASAYETYLNALALVQIEGRSGPLWKAWSPVLRDTLKLMEAGRLWEGSPGNASVVDAALTALGRQIYYHYSLPPFASADPAAGSGRPGEAPEK